MITLNIFLGTDLVGELSNDPQTNRFSFTYSPRWLEGPRPFDLSPRLPMRPAAGGAPEAHSAEVRQFFENLLPEGQGLDAAAVLHQVSKSNLTGLLIHLGSDLAGALRAELAGAARDAEDQEGTEMRPLSRDELSKRIRDRSDQPFSVWDGKIRMSVAGYQDKIVVFEHGGDWSFVNDSARASNRILKPEPVSKAMEGMTGNEFMCMSLARAAGLAVATVRLEHVPEPVLVVERFDRVTSTDGSRVRRLHVIDGCQALGLSAAFKYERPYGGGRDVRHIRDGASLPRLFDLMQLSANPAEQRTALLRWVIFQVLIGNTDAHAKNVSFFCGPAGLRLAPTYDLLCAPAFGQTTLDDEYAMAIGDAFTPQELSALEWAEFANKCGLSLRFVASEMQRLSKAIITLLPDNALIARANQVPERIVTAVHSTITVMCDRHLVLANEVLTVDPKLLSVGTVPTSTSHERPRSL